AEGGGLFPGHVAERVAADVVAERVYVVAGTGTVRVEQLPFHGAEAFLRAGFVEELRVDHHFAVDAHAALFQKEPERISCIQIDTVKSYDSAPLEAEGHLE